MYPTRNANKTKKLLLRTRCRYDSPELLAAASGQATPRNRLVLFHGWGCKAEAEAALVRVEVRLHRHAKAESFLEEPLRGNLAHICAQPLWGRGEGGGGGNI